MDRSHNVFVKLAFRAESGNASAQSELRRKLQPELIHIVRRVLRGGARPVPDGPTHSCGSSGTV